MTLEEKQLLLKDLLCRLPHGVDILTNDGDKGYILGFEIMEGYIIQAGDGHPCFKKVDEFKEYLRPMSSMSEKEKKAFNKFICIDEDAWLGKENGCVNQAKIMSGGVDWLNSHHFDYRGLIEKGLALEAPEDMYKND